MSKYDNAKDPGPGNNPPQKQNQQDQGSATNIPGELDQGRGESRDRPATDEDGGVAEVFDVMKPNQPRGTRDSK